MKIALQAPTIFDSADPAYQRLEALMRSAARVARPDTDLVFVSASGIEIPGMEAFEGLGSRTINDHAVLSSALAAARAPGIDALVVNCFFDPGLWAARQILDIPVLGLAESAMALAGFMGRRFAILPVSQRYAPPMEDMIDLYGHRGGAIGNRPVRGIPADERAAIGWLVQDRLELLVAAVEPVARACIADGADVLILGCGLVSVILSEAAGLTEIDGVPIITPIAAAIKAAEQLVEIKAAGFKIKSDIGYWGQH